MKSFNTEGTCFPQRHYMADTSAKLKATLRMVEQGKYFIINRPRQYGKTTTLVALEKMLRESGKYTVFGIRFAGIGDLVFEHESSFCKQFIHLLAVDSAFFDKPLSDWLKEETNTVADLSGLSDFIARLVQKTGRPIVVMIDEVDKSSNNQLFVSFLAMLRDKYLAAGQGKDYTFHAVVLAGVHDIKTLKLKLRPEDERKLNSPWNIAAAFDVDLSLLPHEIVPMLEDYMQEQGVSMDAPLIAERLFYYTSGYPFLVSRLCQIVDEKLMPQKPAAVWEKDDVATAVSILVKESNTNFDTLAKNLENWEELYGLVYEISVEGKKTEFNAHNTVMSLGSQFGIFKNQNGLRIHNRVYEEVIFNFMITKTQLRFPDAAEGPSSDMLLPGKRLNMEKVMLRFQAFMKEQYSKKDRDFLERHGRLVFLAFLKPIINGSGYDFKEPQISEEHRLDVVITYFQHKYVAELKLWRGKIAHDVGLLQLADYLEQQEVEEGFLLIFNHAEVKSWHSDWTEVDGKKIFMVWV